MLKKMVGNANWASRMSKSRLKRVKNPNFEVNGQVFLVRCPECGKENWAMMVATGQCVWCGWKEE